MDVTREPLHDALVEASLPSTDGEPELPTVLDLLHDDVPRRVVEVYPVSPVVDAVHLSEAIEEAAAEVGVLPSAG